MTRKHKELTPKQKIKYNLSIVESAIDALKGQIQCYNDMNLQVHIDYAIIALENARGLLDPNCDFTEH